MEQRLPRGKPNYGRDSVTAKSEPRASSTLGDDWKLCTGEHQLEENRTGGA